AVNRSRNKIFTKDKNSNNKISREAEALIPVKRKNSEHEATLGVDSNKSLNWSEDTELEFSVGEDLTNTASSFVNETENLPAKEMEPSGNIMDKSNDLRTARTNENRISNQQTESISMNSHKNDIQETSIRSCQIIQEEEDIITNTEVLEEDDLNQVSDITLKITSTPYVQQDNSSMEKTEMLISRNGQEIENDGFIK
ncbi:11558_t:CDS:2, partial [Cetraspora pellucida]